MASPWRRVLALVAGLAAVALVLLLAFRAARRALVPLVPIALATGWSALVLFACAIPLNPMSVTLGALVIAISTEFSVLLSRALPRGARGGHAPAAALERTYRSTGAAVLASGTTAIAGFAVLVVSDIRMLRDFGVRDRRRPHGRARGRDARPARGAPARPSATSRVRALAPRLRRPAPAPPARAAAARPARAGRVSAARRSPGRARAAAAAAGASRYGWFVGVVLVL